ncbi:MAG TPA: hypothetical protein VGH89_25695 [Pseudonocardia sp.]|jgi:hypothetical protein
MHVRDSLAGRRVLVASNDAGIAEHRVRLLDRLVARLRASRLDQLLCQGAAPESSVELAVRADLLVRPGARAKLAAALRELPAMAAQPLSLTAVPLQRDRVRAAACELREVSDRLLAGGPVSAGGVACVRALLTDGAGPLYHGGGPDDLRCRLRAALAAMEIQELSTGD